MSNLIFIRNSLLGFIYRNIFKKILFKIDPELIHDNMIKIGIVLGKSTVTRKITQIFFDYTNKKLNQKILGIDFPNPIGLAAGFDKNAQLVDILPCVGFGFAEVGSITGEPCLGNPKPRLWRLQKSKSLVVNYGLKNNGCGEISANLKNKNFSIPIGISIAKTNSPETVDTKSGIADYIKAFKKFTKIGAYFTINISCPNAYGGLPFTEPQKLDQLLKEIDKIPTTKPIFIKLSPDLTRGEVDEIINISQRHRIHGFICTNLTKLRNNGKIIDSDIPQKGGISGKVVEDLSNGLISYVYQKTKGKYIIIGCGGVFSAKDAYKKIRLGASLIQMATGMIFEGPQVISEINLGLVCLLERDGFTSIAQAVGASLNNITR